jgi:hypothetical protein
MVRDRKNTKNILEYKKTLKSQSKIQKPAPLREKKIIYIIYI